MGSSWISTHSNCTVGEEVHHLTLMEAQLLQYLIRSAGRPVSRKSILEEVWGLHEDTDTRAIDNFIVRLRRYIEEDPSHPKHLQTVRGVGYRFFVEPERRLDSAISRHRHFHRCCQR